MNAYLFTVSRLSNWFFRSFLCFGEEETFAAMRSALSSFISLSIFSRKHGSQYGTELPPFQPATVSSFSNTEHRIQKYSWHLRQVYLVVSKQEEQAHSSFPAILFKMKSFCACQVDGTRRPLG